MKTRVVVLAVFLFVLSQSVQAADLQAGWYAKAGVVALWGYRGGYLIGVDWNFVGGTGTYEPYIVTNPDPLWPQRMVQVNQTQTGVPNGTAVYLYGEPEVPVDFPAFALDVGYETDYDPSQMRLELWQHHSDGRDELIWFQGRSGHILASADVLDGTGRTIGVGDSIYFRVVAVPEPSQLATLIGLLGALAHARRRYRKC